MTPEDITAWVHEHVREHHALLARMEAHERSATLREERIAILQHQVQAIGDLHDFMVSMRAMGRSVQWIFGGSIIAGITASLALVVSVSHLIGG